MLDIPAQVMRSRDEGDQADLLPKEGEQVLLINPPVYDTRLHWAKWQQPIRLLKLATHCRQVGAEVRLIDMLQPARGKSLHKHRVGVFDLDGLAVNKWRFGTAKSALTEGLRTAHRDGWRPDKVYVDCFTTFWWEGAKEVIECLKQRFPGAQVIVVGAYAELEPQHVLEHTRADKVLTGHEGELATLPTDLSVYEEPPHFAYISLGNGRRTADEVVEEIELKVREWAVLHFAFPESKIVSQFRELYREVLELLVERRLKVKLYAAGNIAPADLVGQRELAVLMKQAGYAQIYFADDRDGPRSAEANERLIEEYREAAELCRLAGFQMHTENVCGGVCLGRLGETLEERSRLITLVAHHIGAVIIWPYLPSADECPEMPLEERNGKLFPLRARNGYTLRDYLNVMGLATVLNSKYRTKTFDFLGDGLVARLFQESVGRRGWDPEPDVKGNMKLPVVIRP
jgi:hypothetical protein